MDWIRPVVGMLAALFASGSSAQSPPLDSSPRHFSGDWLGVGPQDLFCFLRLDVAGTGTVLVSSASGDWSGATFRWRNDRQRLVLLAAAPMASQPQRRLGPLTGWSLQAVFGGTLQLALDKRAPACELQRRAGMATRTGEAEALLIDPAAAVVPHGRKP